MIDLDENEKTKKKSKKKIIKKDENGKESDSEVQEEKEEIKKAKSKKKYDKISIYLSGEEFNKKKLDLYLSLSDLRELLDDEIEKNSVFIEKEGKNINLDDEENLSISLILNNKKLKIETKPKIKKKKKEKDTKEKTESISKAKEEAESADKLETKNNIINSDNKEDTPIEKEKKSINGDKKKEKEKENSEEEEDKKKKNEPSDEEYFYEEDKKKKYRESSDEEYSEEKNKKKKKKKKKKKESSSEEYSDGEDKKKKKGADEIDGSSKFTPVPKNNIPLPDCELIEKIGELDIYLYNSPNLTDEELSQAITIMVVGEIGTGKTTLLNCYLNYLLGIEISDKFRYKLICEIPSKFRENEKCQTSEVRIYKIKRPVGKPIIIVDTPGFGDTSGIETDINTVAKIKDCLTNKISTINAVCFVTKASTYRLTSSKKYVFDSVLNLFGNDIKENFVIMCTFCDGAEPQIVEALQSDESIFKDIINYLEKDEWYYQFNNSAFFNSKIDEYIKFFYKISMMSYEKFTRKIEKLPAKSLSLTRKVLDERAKLENSVSNLTLQLDNALNIMNNLKNTIKQVEKLKGDLKDNKDFVIEVDEFYIEKIDLRGKGIYTTTCLKCNFTCHNNCSYSDDSDKKNCVAFQNDYCTE